MNENIIIEIDDPEITESDLSLWVPGDNFGIYENGEE